jgi:hypothetical protein
VNDVMKARLSAVSTRQDLSVARQYLSPVTVTATIARLLPTTCGPPESP